MSDEINRAESLIGVLASSDTVSFGGVSLVLRDLVAFSKGLIEGANTLTRRIERRDDTVFRLESELESMRKGGANLVKINTERYEAQVKTHEKNVQLTAVNVMLSLKLNVALLGCSDPKDCIGWMTEFTSPTQWQCGRCSNLFKLMHDPEDNEIETCCEDPELFTPCDTDNIQWCGYQCCENCHTIVKENGEVFMRRPFKEDEV